MAGIMSEESGVGRPEEGVSSAQSSHSSAQSSHSGEALAEWRSSEQVENGTSTTSPPYWDTDDDDDDGGGGPKPCELYGKHTWRIPKFSQINKRELRGETFEVGGYKWYILIYPQGCDVCNHLSLFLCVANHDKLLPGWSHFAQFTIAVVNKDPKKSKYSDTLHRFWKKEHDWGWKKFMELTKIHDGFLDADTLIIKAQVQVIREKADRPFRCLDPHYRRELVRVYLTNVEQICRRFVEERRGKLGKLREDKARWSSFCAFWLSIDQNARRRMSKEKTDVILKVVVKHFFVEKEVTSTLVMDSLYSGLKALEGQSKCKKGRTKGSDADEMPAPIVCIEKDTFVLVDDVLLLLERAAMEPLPPKDEKGPQNRTKDGNSGEDFNKDSIERDERRLTELGRRTVEIFVLAHIFSNKIEVAYQEAVALKRQEELIREEEAAWLAESEQKAKRGANAKEKKSKKKQAKQKRLNRKAKDKEREERNFAQENNQQEDAGDEKEELMLEQVQPVLEKSDALEDGSDLSDLVECGAEVMQADSEERDASPVNWDTDTSEVHHATEACSSAVGGLSPVQNGVFERRSPSTMDDSSSTCSTDSVPSVVMSGLQKGNFFPNHKSHRSPGRGKGQRGKGAHDGNSWANKTDNQPSGPLVDTGESCDVSGCSSKAADTESGAGASSLRDQRTQLEQQVKKEEVSSQQNKWNIKDDIDEEKLSKERRGVVQSPSSSPPIDVAPNIQQKTDRKGTSSTDPCLAKKPFFNGMQQNEKSASLMNSSETCSSKPEISKAATPKGTEPAVLQVPMMSRPSSAPLVPGIRPGAPVVSMVQTTPLLARSVSAVGRLGPETSSATQSYIPQSYRNAIMGNSIPSSSAVFTSLSSPSPAGKASVAYSQSPALMSAQGFLSPSTERLDYGVKPGFPFGLLNRDVLKNGPQWLEGPDSRSAPSDPSSLQHDSRNLDYYNPVSSNTHGELPEFQACTSGRQAQGLTADDFPHLDIINDLLDDEQFGKGSMANPFYHPLNGSHSLNRQFSFPGEVGVLGDLESSTSSCRFERTRSYCDNKFQRGYSSFSGSFDSSREFIPQVSIRPYANGQIDGLIPSQWHRTGADLSILGMKNPDGDGYPYYSPDYTNYSCTVNGYTAYRPPNGH